MKELTVIQNCVICNTELSKEVYICGFCGCTPLCNSCSAQGDKGCPNCDPPSDSQVVEHYGTGEIINLFCSWCRKVTSHERDDTNYIWCADCLCIWEPQKVTSEQMWAEGVDSERLLQHLEDLGYLGEQSQSHEQEPTTHPIVELYCFLCKLQTEHKYASIEDGKKLYACVICNSQRLNPQNQSYASAYHGGRYGDYEGYVGQYSARACAHWRNPVQISCYKVTASASYDVPKDYQASETKLPDFGVYLSPSWSSRLTTTPNFPDKLAVSTKCPSIFFEWTDFAAPRQPLFVALIDWLLEKIQDGKHIDIGCIGGHGRTGTMLAILLVELEGLKAQDAINTVRERHCQKAIESRAQEDFIYSWAGEPPPKRPATSSAVQRAQQPVYATRDEKRKAKAYRKNQRRELKSLVYKAKSQAKSEGVCWEEYRKTVFEKESLYWVCDVCSTYQTDHRLLMGTREDSYIWLQCAHCNRYTRHSRPKTVFQG